MERPFERCYWVEDGAFLAGALPAHKDLETMRGRLRRFLDLGIQRFINLMEPNERDHEGNLFSPYEPLLTELALKDGRPVPRCQRFPIPDMKVPSREFLVSILDAIDQARKEQPPVYVHCGGGKGRTGTVVGCWLIRHGKATPEDVLSVIHELRKEDAIRTQPSPETPEQICLVKTWREKN